MLQKLLNISGWKAINTDKT